MFRNSAVVGLMFVSEASQVAMNGAPTVNASLIVENRHKKKRTGVRFCEGFSALTRSRSSSDADSGG